MPFGDLLRLVDWHPSTKTLVFSQRLLLNLAKPSQTVRITSPNVTSIKQNHGLSDRRNASNASRKAAGGGFRFPESRIPLNVSAESSFDAGASVGDRSPKLLNASSTSGLLDPSSIFGFKSRTPCQRSEIAASLAHPTAILRATYDPVHHVSPSGNPGPYQ